MKLGIIIVFNSFENSFPKEALIEKINSLNDVCICLVNNKSNTNTENYLNEISENCKNTSVVNIKMSKSLNSAIRVGARYMFNRHNLKHLGYINDQTNLQIIEVIEGFKKNRDELFNLVVNRQNKKSISQTQFQRLFSIKQYLMDLNSKLM
jgi:hypothetical protein